MQVKDGLFLCQARQQRKPPTEQHAGLYARTGGTEG
jgi:hypothetical protein